ncbi:hypothetical protein FACS189431_1790 [Alphaproteobacteria bacterium]|nr:hypothetical protein FACS189431_1790 [Alphaproteobacteria bacterium]
MPSVTLRVADSKTYDVYKIARTVAEATSCTGQVPTPVDSVSVGVELLVHGKPWLIVHCLPRPKPELWVANRIRRRLVREGELSEDTHIYVYYDIDKRKLV